MVDIILSSVLAIVSSVLAILCVELKDDLIAVLSASSSLLTLSFAYLHRGLVSLFVVQLSVAISVLIVLGLLCTSLRRSLPPSSNRIAIALFVLLFILLIGICFKLPSLSVGSLLPSGSAFSLLILHAFLLVILALGIKHVMKVMRT